MKDTDKFVPDRLVRDEFSVSAMTLWRWDHDPDLHFPPPILIQGRKFRSRKALEEFKERMLLDAIKRRA